MKACKLRLLLSALLLLTACGFHLRGSLTSSIASISFQSAGESVVVAQMQNLLRNYPSVRIVDEQNSPELRVQWLSEQRDRVAQVIGVGGQVLSFRLTYTANFQWSKNGRDWVQQKVLQSRDLQYSEADALAKQNEEALIWDNLKDSLADKVLRVLLNPPQITNGASVAQ